MAKVSVIKTNFTAGETSPRLRARVDVARFANSVETMENFIPLVHGGAKRRGGLRYRAAAKNATKPARLIPFVFSREQAFMLELGELYIRFYTGAGQVLSGGLPYEIASPWDDAELDDLKYVQGKDTVFFAHPSYPMRKLVRFANTNWKLSAVTFEVPPSDEIGERAATTLSLSATSGGAVTATAGAPSFLAGDVGRWLESAQGRGQITVFTDTTHVTVNIAAADAFASTGPIASGSWKITESPKTELTPSATGPVGATITLTGSANTWKNTAQVNHVGMFVEINGGLAEVSGYTSPTVVDAIVRTELASTTAAPSGGWALRQTVWNSVDGYPRAVTRFKQRLIAGGSTAYPNTIWGSRVGEYFNFADGTDDSDGYAFELDSDQANDIEHLASNKSLLALTFGAEFELRGGVEKPITPTNVSADSPTGRGCNFARPVRVADELLFVQRGGKKIRALGYRVEKDGFNAPDVSVLSEHITGDGIYEMAFAQEPDQVVWMARADGQFPTMSIDRDQDAIGFARQFTDGQVESVATMPYANQDQVWAIVVREIDGAEVRYVETIDEDCNTDCCITGAVGEGDDPTDVWGGLDHLEGMTVDVVADGYVASQQVVTGGEITLERAASSVEIGLHYDSTIVDHPPEVVLGGTAQGSAMSINEIVVRFHETIGGRINGNQLPVRRFGEAVLDQPLERFTGDKRVDNLGWGRAGSGDSPGTVTVMQDQPLPMQVLGIIKKVTVNG